MTWWHAVAVLCFLAASAFGLLVLLALLAASSAADQLNEFLHEHDDDQ